MNQRLFVLSLMLFSLITPMTGFAHNRVVVVPLGGQGGNIPNIITVAQSGGDFTSVLTAVNSIKDASAEKPYAIYLAPGEYDLADGQLKMQPYVNIFGSGPGVTILKSSRSGTTWMEASCILGANNTHLSNFTLKLTAAGSYVVALGNFDVSPTISNLEIIQQGFGVTTIGIVNSNGSPVISSTSVSIKDIHNNNYGIWNVFSAPVIKDVSVDVSFGAVNNIGIRNDAAAATLNNVHAKVFTNTGTNIGMQCVDSNSLYITGSRFEADGSALNSYGLSINSGSINAQITNSQIVGGWDDNASGTQCWMVYDGNLGWVDC